MARGRGAIAAGYGTAPVTGTPLAATSETATSRWSAAAPPASTSRSRPRRAAPAAALVSRKPLAESSSFWAQGGLAAALAADDSPERHAADTLAAGRGALPPERGRGR